MPMFDPAIFDASIFDTASGGGGGLNPSTIMGAAAIWYADAAASPLWQNTDGTGAVTDGSVVRRIDGLAGPNALAGATDREAVYRAGGGDPYLEGDASTQLRGTLPRTGDFYAIVRIQFRGTGSQQDQAFTLATDTTTFYNGTAWANIGLNPFVGPQSARMEVGSGTQPPLVTTTRDTWITVEIYGTATVNALAVNGSAFVTGARTGAFPDTAYFDIFNSTEGGSPHPDTPTWFRRGAILNAIPDSTQRASLLSWAMDGDPGGAGSVNAALTATEASDTAAFSINARHTATLAATEASDVFSGVAVVGDVASGFLAATEASDTAAFEINARHTASLTATEPSDTAAFAVNARHTAALAATEASDIFAGAATVSSTATATLTATEPSDTAAFSINASHTAVLAATEASDTASFSINASHTAALAATEASDTASFSVNASHTAALAATEASDTFSGIVSGSIAGALAATEPADIAAFNVNALSIATITLAGNEQADTAAFNILLEALAGSGEGILVPWENRRISVKSDTSELTSEAVFIYVPTETKSVNVPHENRTARAKARLRV